MKTEYVIILTLFVLNTICANAQIIQQNQYTPLKVTPVKTLKDNPQKIKGTLVAPNGKHYFFTDKRYFRYSKEHGLEKIANTSPNWSGIPDNIDGVFVNPKNDKAYFFKGSKYNRWDFKKGNDNPELAISRYWEGVPNDIDAVTNHPNGKIYFFKGDTYYRYDPVLKKVDNTALISKNWKGVPNNVAAALLHKNGKIYFFKGNKYYRYSIQSRKVDNVGSGTIGKNGWKGLDFEKKNFTKKIESAAAIAAAAAKDNIRLKVTLTRIKSIQARDNDNIADFILEQNVNYRANGTQKLAIEKNIKVGKNIINTGERKYYDKDESSSIFYKGHRTSSQIHVREGDENHFINNSLIYEITPQEIKDKRADFNFYTNLGEVNGADWLFETLFALFFSDEIKKIAFRHRIDVNIYEVLDYLQNPKAAKYGKSYFNGGSSGDMHEYGAFGDIMWFKKGSNNSLIGTLEFGDNNKETYVRLYYRFELVH